MSFDLRAYLDEHRRVIDDALNAYMPPAQQMPSRIHEAMRYSLFCGGKRLRPILTLAGAEAVGGEWKTVLPLACAVECIHTFSLIHDDLPALDDDDLRRGNPTNHVVYGEAMAILAGDALLALAFELIVECRLFAPPDRTLDALAMVAPRLRHTWAWSADRSPTSRVKAETTLDEPTISSIHARKTGALLMASLLSVARLCGASIAQEAALRIYGEHLGLAFQITDDILDLEGDADKLGKPIGSDLRQDKATYPKILGLAASCRLAARSSDAAVSALTNSTSGRSLCAPSPATSSSVTARKILENPAVEVRAIRCRLGEAGRGDCRRGHCGSSRCRLLQIRADLELDLHRAGHAGGRTRFRDHRHVKRRGRRLADHRTGVRVEFQYSHAIHAACDTHPRRPAPAVRPSQKWPW